MAHGISARRFCYLLQAHCCLLRIHRALDHGGFKEAKRYLRPWASDSRSLPMDSSALRDIEWAVETACQYQWRRTVCLHRAITAYMMLQVKKARPVYITGVMNHPFASHAWVEVEGRPFADSEMNASRYHYRPILTVPDHTNVPGYTVLENAR